MLRQNWRCYSDGLREQTRVSCGTSLFLSDLRGACINPPRECLNPAQSTFRSISFSQNGLRSRCESKHMIQAALNSSLSRESASAPATVCVRGDFQVAHTAEIRDVNFSYSPVW